MYVYAIFDLVLYLKSEGLNISWIYRYIAILELKNGIPNAVFCFVDNW